MTTAQSHTHGSSAGRAGRRDDAWSAAAVDGLKTVAGAVFGAAAGLLVASFLFTAAGPGVRLMAVLVGLTLGVLLLGPGRPRALEDWLGRGILAVAMVVIGAVLMGGASSLVGAWAACSIGLGLASHDPTTGKRRQRPTLAEAFFRMAMAAAATGVAFYVLLSGSGGLGAPSVMTLAAIMGVGGFLAGWMEVEAPAATPPGLTSRPSDKASKPRKARSAGKPTVDASFDADGEDDSVGADTFAAEFARLVSVAERVETLLSRTERENPSEEAFVDSVRERVQTMMVQVEASVRRWRKAGDGFETERLGEIRQQLEANRATLQETADAAMRRELDLAIERQERMLSMLQSMERARTTFGFRLAQVTSGLELLEVTLKRALTVGEGIDTSEIDALVEVMDAFDDDEAEVETGLERPTPEPREQPVTREEDAADDGEPAADA